MKPTAKNARPLKRLIRIAIVVFFVSYGLTISSCSRYDPSLYPSYDVLNPGEEVRKNPVGWIENGKVVNDAGEEIFIEKGVIVNEAFSQWVVELRKEIVRLRKK